MRNIPVALQTHIDGEVLSLARCMKITRLDGTIVRLTTHDVNLTVNGDVYSAGVPLDISAIQSTDTLSVDNAEMMMGIDGIIIKQEDLDGGLYDGVAFELFLVNWEDTGDGVIYLKRGTFGDIELVSDLSARIQLRGLTQALQRPIVERYSPTCRVALGGKKCGIPNIPTRVRRENQKVKTFDWFLVPDANITTPSLTNLSFESSPITTGWTIPSGSSWTRESALTPYNGTYYALAGSGTVGQEHVIYRDMDTATIGMGNTDVDDGDFSIDFTIQIAGASALFANAAKVFVEQYTATGVSIKREESDFVTPEFEEWQGIGLTAFILPTCRTIRVGIINRINEGTSGYIAVDNAQIRYFTNVMSTWNSKVFRTMKIPAYAASELVPASNFSFETNGAVANTNVAANITGWTFANTEYWRVVTALGGLTPQSGTYFLAGGDDGSTTPGQVYTMSQDVTLPLGALAQNVTDGWYYSELKFSVASNDTSTPEVTLQFYSATNTLLGTVGTGPISGLTPGVWSSRSLYLRVPAGASYARITLTSTSGSGGSASTGSFDNLRLYYFPTAYEHDSDADYGNLAQGAVTYDFGANDYTLDGEVIVQARTPVFAYATVTAVTDNRVFTASAISDTAALLYSGRIVWLSGANAGKTSYIRIWNNTTKVIKMYDALLQSIQVGDKFVYAKGCDKTIARCADTFGNAHNFRGEPYLPGPSKVIEFLTTA